MGARLSARLGVKLVAISCAILLPGVLLAGCGQHGPASLLAAAPPALDQTGSVVPDAAAAEVSLLAPGSATDVYALVARGALNCWFGADGPLKKTHVFHAEAAPPAKGGGAEIVLQARDASLADQRGIRVLRVTFVAQGGSTLVAVSRSRFDPRGTTAMIEDVTHWARGQAGCRLQAELPPIAVPQPQPSGKFTARGAP